MKKRYWLLLTLVILIAILVIGLLIPAGYFKSIISHFDGETIAIYDEAHGAEDLDIDYQNEMLFISATNRRKLKEEDTANGIYTLDLKADEARPKLLTTNYSKAMFPHGISVFHADSSTYLYMINHLGDEDFIELFKYRKDSIIHLRSFSDPLMISPNDIVGISKDEFYITNDHSSKDPIQDQKEDFMRLKNRNIIHYRNGQYREAANGLAMPNGINVSNDKKLLYTVTTLGHQFITYERDLNSGTLKEINRVDLDSGLDNIDIDVQGNIWIGSHPQVLKFLGHVNDPNKLSPSQIFKLTPTSSGQYEATEIYLNDGSEIAASSIGVHFNNELFIGAVFDQKVVRLRMNQ